jgi:hypothetical protein
MDGMEIEALRDYRRRVDGLSLFSDWNATPEQRQACRGNLAKTLEKLIALGPHGSVDDATDLLRQCIEEFNELDEGFIGTIEREQLCDMLYDIGDLCGLDGEEEWVDEWRDW